MLGLPHGAAPEDIKIAWRDLAKVWHPDRFAHDERLRGKAGENLKRINEAYESLRDYDPAMQPRISSRIRESVSIVLGMGELGEPPAAGAAGGTIVPTGPIGMRRSLRILGLGTLRATGEGRAIDPARRGLLFLVIALLTALLGLAVYFFVLRTHSQVP
ncbi:MAG: DnaJ domain-containing protein [Gemmatimonadales bacterium]